MTVYLQYRSPDTIFFYYKVWQGYHHDCGGKVSWETNECAEYREAAYLDGRFTTISDSTMIVLMCDRCQQRGPGRLVKA